MKRYNIVWELCWCLWNADPSINDPRVTELLREHHMNSPWPLAKWKDVFCFLCCIRPSHLPWQFSLQIVRESIHPVILMCDLASYENSVWSKFLLIMYYICDLWTCTASYVLRRHRRCSQPMSSHYTHTHTHIPLTFGSAQLVQLPKAYLPASCFFERGKNCIPVYGYTHTPTHSHIHGRHMLIIISSQIPQWL